MIGSVPFLSSMSTLDRERTFQFSFNVISYSDISSILECCCWCCWNIWNFLHKQGDKNVLAFQYFPAHIHMICIVFCFFYFIIFFKHSFGQGFVQMKVVWPKAWVFNKSSMPHSVWAYLVKVSEMKWKHVSFVSVQKLTKGLFEPLSALSHSDEAPESDV